MSYVLFLCPDAHVSTRLLMSFLNTTSGVKRTETVDSLAANKMNVKQTNILVAKVD